MKLDNYLVSKEKEKQTIEHFTQAIFHKGPDGHYVCPGTLAGSVGWWEGPEWTESSEVLPQGICRLPGSGWTHDGYNLAVDFTTEFWQTGGVWPL